MVDLCAEMRRCRGLSAISLMIIRKLSTLLIRIPSHLIRTGVLHRYAVALSRDTFSREFMCISVIS